MSVVYSSKDNVAQFICRRGWRPNGPKRFGYRLDWKLPEEVDMKNARKTMIAILVVAALVAVPFGEAALAQFRPDAKEPDAVAMMIDVVPVRVLSFCGMVIGTAFFLVTIPVSYFAGSHEEAAEKMIAEPARYTFTRPLGEFR
jgi:hypothetical protein